MSTGVTSDTEEEIQQKEENVHLSQRTLKEMDRFVTLSKNLNPCESVIKELKEIDERLVTLSKNLNQCESVINDLMALKHVLETKSLQDVCYQN